MYKYFLVIFLLLVGDKTNAQNKSLSVEHYISLKNQFCQIEEANNYGLVFNGFNLGAEYNLKIKKSDLIFVYSPELNIGPTFNKGIGINWRFRPIDIYYGFSIYNTENNNLYLGPYLITNYQVQLYPELQSGHLFWFTFFDFGPKIIYEFKFYKIPISISFANSIAGFGSRPKIDPQLESHFYTLIFFDWISSINSNFKFGSFNLLNHSNIKIGLENFIKNDLSLSYEIEYYGYFKEPKLNYLSHSLNLVWCIGNGNK